MKSVHCGSYLEWFWHVRMVWDVQIWKLTFHAKGMASETGPDGKCRCNLSTASDIVRPGEKIKKVLAKALNLILDGGAQSLQIARLICPLIWLLTYFRG